MHLQSNDLICLCSTRSSDGGGFEIHGKGEKYRIGCDGGVDYIGMLSYWKER